MSFQVQPAPRMAKAPMKNSAICQGLGPRACARPRPAPPTTSTAAATARSRSGGRAGTAADKDATKPGRACRPNCRSRPRPNRPLIGVTAHRPADCRSACRSVPRPVLVFAAEIDRRRLDGVAERGCLSDGDRSSLQAMVAELRRLFMIGFGIGDRLVGHAARGLVVDRGISARFLRRRRRSSSACRSACDRPWPSSRPGRHPPFLCAFR